MTIARARSTTLVSTARAPPARRRAAVGRAPPAGLSCQPAGSWPSSSLEPQRQPRRRTASRRRGRRRTASAVASGRREQPGRRGRSRRRRSPASAVRPGADAERSPRRRAPRGQRAPVVDLAVGQPRQVGQHHDVDDARPASPAARGASGVTAAVRRRDARRRRPRARAGPPRRRRRRRSPGERERALDVVEVDAGGRRPWRSGCAGRRPPTARRGGRGPGRRCAARARSSAQREVGGLGGVAEHHVGAGGRRARRRRARGRPGRSSRSELEGACRAAGGRSTSGAAQRRGRAGSTLIRAVASVAPYITNRSKPRRWPSSANARTRSGAIRPPAWVRVRSDGVERSAKPPRSSSSKVCGTPGIVVTPWAATSVPEALVEHGRVGEQQPRTAQQVAVQDREAVAVVQRQRRRRDVVGSRSRGTRRSPRRWRARRRGPSRTSLGEPVVPLVESSRARSGCKCVRRRLSSADIAATAVRRRRRGRTPRQLASACEPATSTTWAAARAPRYSTTDSMSLPGTIMTSRRAPA